MTRTSTTGDRAASAESRTYCGICSNGAVALNMLMDSYEDRRFDIVLMDLQMRDGRVENLKRFRAFEEHSLNL
jgi:hypothetical protein